MGGKTVVLGLSGGVDSPWPPACSRSRATRSTGIGWIGLGGREDAQQVAETSASLFRRRYPPGAGGVGDGPLSWDYPAGRTPPPCARCNPTVKFPPVPAGGGGGGDWVATGHYARIAAGPAGEPLLCRGAHTNDQAYMLARLPQHWLSRLVFPIGGYEKTQVRQLARDFGLPVAEKPDSMEICFIPDGDYAAWLEARGAVPPPGHFVDRTGRVLGRHRGIHRYTIGQRRGLGIPAAHRLFVSEIRPETQEVVLSDGTDLMADTVWGEDFNPLAPLTEGEELTVRLRHSKTETPARFYPEGTGGRLELLTPARAPTPGQLAVLYRGDWVLGSLWITRARRIPG